MAGVQWKLMRAVWKLGPKDLLGGANAGWSQVLAGWGPWVEIGLELGRGKPLLWPQGVGRRWLVGPTGNPLERAIGFLARTLGLEARAGFPGRAYWAVCQGGYHAQVQRARQGLILDPKTGWSLVCAKPGPPSFLHRELAGAPGGLGPGFYRLGNV